MHFSRLKKTVCLKKIHVTLFNRDYTTVLSEVGRLEAPSNGSDYSTGQLFLHRLFGYRGVVLFPWAAKVFDRDKTKKKLSDSEISSRTPENSSATERNTFYNVLIDARDCPFIRSQTSAVTFLSKDKEGKVLFAIPGLDYAAHEDILPYSPRGQDPQPLEHDLVSQLLTLQEGRFQPQDVLYEWQHRNQPWLEVQQVHRQTTERIRVTIIPFYMGQRESFLSEVYWWRYWVCLENKGELAVRVRERHWRIFSTSGALETVRGRGVMGQEPVLGPGAPAYQYSSHVSLQVPSGHMWGTLLLQREDGALFDCKIPPFSLHGRDSKTPPPHIPASDSE